MLRYSHVLRRHLLIISMLLGAAASSRAQYDPSFSHYFDMETAYNPAAAGKQPKLNATVAYALDMAGFFGAA